MNTSIYIVILAMAFAAAANWCFVTAADLHLKMKDHQILPFLIIYVMLTACIGGILVNYPDIKAVTLSMVGVVYIATSLLWMEKFNGYRPFYFDAAGIAIFMFGVASVIFGLHFHWSK